MAQVLDDGRTDLVRGTAGRAHGDPRREMASLQWVVENGQPTTDVHAELCQSAEYRRCLVKRFVFVVFGLGGCIMITLLN